MPKKAKKSKSRKSGLVIVKEKPHPIHSKPPYNFKPQYVVQQKPKTMADGTIRGMAYYRETTLKKAQATKKWLERKWEKGEKMSKVKTKRRKK